MLLSGVEMRDHGNNAADSRQSATSISSEATLRGSTCKYIIV